MGNEHFEYWKFSISCHYLNVCDWKITLLSNCMSVTHKCVGLLKKVRYIHFSWSRKLRNKLSCTDHVQWMHLDDLNVTFSQNRKLTTSKTALISIYQTLLNHGVIILTTCLKMVHYIKEKNSILLVRIYTFLNCFSPFFKIRFLC